MEGFARLELSNVRCFDSLSLELHPRVTVLLGENGAGKTTIAEALASLCHGEDEGLAAFPLRRGAESGAVCLFAAGDDRPIAAWQTGDAERRERLRDRQYLFAYGRYRRIPTEPAAPPPGPGPELLGPEWAAAFEPAPFADLSNAVLRRRTTTVTRPDNHLLRDVAAYLVQLHDELRAVDPGMARAWERLSASLSALGEGLERIEVRDAGGRRRPFIVRHGVPLELRDLSDGYQSMLVIVFDLILRYVYLFSQLDDPLAGTATVVIDEVDLHLHPRWQRVVLRQLTTLFPRTQFVVTTHSPAVVQGAIDEDFGVVVLGGEEGRVVARALDDETRRDLVGAEVGSLLVESRLFGVASRYSSRFEAVERDVGALRARVEEGHATRAERERLVRALEKLQELSALEDRRRQSGAMMSTIAAAQLAWLRELERRLAAEAP